jgi:hypothetical protein
VRGRVGGNGLDNSARVCVYQVDHSRYECEKALATDITRYRSCVVEWRGWCQDKTKTVTRAGLVAEVLRSSSLVYFAEVSLRVLESER